MCSHTRVLTERGEGGDCLFGFWHVPQARSNPHNHNVFQNLLCIFWGFWTSIITYSAFECDHVSEWTALSGKLHRSAVSPSFWFHWKSAPRANIMRGCSDKSCLPSLLLPFPSVNSWAAGDNSGNHYCLYQCKTRVLQWGLKSNISACSKHGCI